MIGLIVAIIVVYILAGSALHKARAKASKGWRTVDRVVLAGVVTAAAFGLQGRALGVPAAVIGAAFLALTAYVEFAM